MIIASALAWWDIFGMAIARSNYSLRRQMVENDVSAPRWLFGSALARHGCSRCVILLENVFGFQNSCHDCPAGKQGLSRQWRRFPSAEGPVHCLAPPRQAVTVPLPGS